MVNFFLKNVQSIIVAIIFIVIIEMLLPNGANKKYVKIVSGIYLMITILNPFLKLFHREFEFDFSNEFSSIETSSSNNLNLQDYYSMSIKEAMKLELKKNGFEIENIDISLNEDYSQILKIVIKGTNIESQSSVKEFLWKNYNVEANKIIFI